VAEITELAERLGKAIAASPEATKLREARDALAGEPELSKVLKEFQDQSEKIATLESENKPVEVDDKHKLRGLHEKLVASETFKKYTAAQVDYVDMMRKVNDALQAPLGETEKD
jgi:cell fate (sporulation/competence/biofilm development) regulator YlbF (YheA/YmcA/DUF963 family)